MVRISRRIILRSLCLICSYLLSHPAFAQTGSCPLNIDFELGNFNNWQCDTGSTKATVNINTNFINVIPSVPIPYRHGIIPKGNLVDKYSGIALSPPDGGNFSVKLGNDSVNAQAERISYTFTVPQTQANFNITYQYAVVLQDPGHPASQQPRFTAKVFDITDSTYIDCSSFEYVATSNLPGFKTSTLPVFQSGANTVIYKDWTAVNINLNGYQGHRLRLEFTTADCTLGAHFGYAYVDVKSSCSSLITGNDFCPSQPIVTLNGPAGFKQYNWYSADRSKLLGTGVNLSLPSAGLDGTSLQLDLIPFTNFGCPNTITAVLHALPAVTFAITNPVQVCYPSVIDITDAGIITGSDANLTYTYWLDAAASIPIASPKTINASGTYYIKATAPTGCFDIKPVTVVINQLPVLKITDPPTVCLTTPVDITNPAVINGSSAGLNYSYWLDALATQPLTTPSAIKTVGTYYIKAVNSSGCFLIKPVNVTFYPPPLLIVNNPPAVCFPGIIDITAKAVTNGSGAGLSFSYWADTAATISLVSPDKVAQSGTYYIKAINNNGCETIEPVIVTINPLPQLVITNPSQVFIPDKIDITAPAVTNGSSNVSTLTYWVDAKATISLTTPKAISDSGVYYIKAISPLGCELIKPVLVTIHQTPVLSITNPAKVYVPNTVDITKNGVTNGNTSRLTLTYWKDINATDQITNPTAISQAGTYYIKGSNTYCYDIEPVEVTISLVPRILVPTAFTPTKTNNNILFPFLIGIKTFISFKVYDRWGELVFQGNSADPRQGWNGMYKGKMQFLDTFTWYAEGYDYSDNLVHKSGNTVLLK